MTSLHGDALSPSVVGSASYVRPPLSRPEKYERLAFTFCRMGTIGLLAWLATPPVFVLAVASIAIVLYARSISLGVSWSKCFLRRPTLIVGFWAAVAVLDAYWLFVLGQHLPS
jgi:hypothetical protein